MCTMRFARVALVAVGVLLGARTTSADPPKGPDKKFAPTALGMEVPVITSADDLDKYVGQLVAVRGVVQNRKPPNVIGVWVDVPDKLRHPEAEVFAIGILRKFTITEAGFRQVQDDARKAGNLVGVATPGPGDYYQLFADLNWKLAEAKPVPKAEDK
jgi:hypothetical protein